MSPMGWTGHSPPLQPPLLLPRPPHPAIQLPPLSRPPPLWSTPNHYFKNQTNTRYQLSRASMHLTIYYKPSSNDSSGHRRLPSRDAYGEKEVVQHTSECGHIEQFQATSCLTCHLNRLLREHYTPSLLLPEPKTLSLQLPITMPQKKLDVKEHISNCITPVFLDKIIKTKKATQTR